MRFWQNRSRINYPPGCCPARCTTEHDLQTGPTHLFISPKGREARISQAGYPEADTFGDATKSGDMHLWRCSREELKLHQIRTATLYTLRVQGRLVRGAGWKGCGPGVDPTQLLQLCCHTILGCGMERRRRRAAAKQLPGVAQCGDVAANMVMMTKVSGRRICCLLLTARMLS